VVLVNELLATLRARIAADTGLRERLSSCERYTAK